MVGLEAGKVEKGVEGCEHKGKKKARGGSQRHGAGELFGNMLHQEGEAEVEPVDSFSRREERACSS